MIQVYLVAGPTGSGKTTFSHLIAPILNSVILSMDNYFFDLDERPKEYSDKYGEAPQSDSPDAINKVLLISNVRQLFQDGQSYIPQYDFVAEKRMEDQIIHRKQEQAIIIDGVHSITFKQEIKSLGLSICSIFLNASEEIRFSRIKKRNVEERGDPEHLFDRQLHFIRSGEKQWVLEQEEDADLVLNTELDTSQTVEMFKEYLQI
jgi:uridine kinase